ncbi:MAG: TlyA family RNA methyltransferase [Chloroflexi bacterium]|nr:TlyA family RNA methyltransferase [Chloroflexota bacterium]
MERRRAAAAKRRLDQLLVERELATTREQARALIMAGQVRIGDRVADKPGHLVPADAAVAVERPLPYVSRGGFKLAHALDAFGIGVAGAVAADVGASTGGFTDVLLQRGAARVYAIDVGYGQLDYRLRTDPRVVVMEKTNVRYLAGLPEPIDLATIDVSFISLEKVLPVVKGWLSPAGQIVALVKPQFEAGRAQVGRGGVVRDPAVHGTVLARVLRFTESLGLVPTGVVASPVLGPAGNREFLVWLRQAGPGVDVAAAIETAIGQSD